MKIGHKILQVFGIILVGLGIAGMAKSLYYGLAPEATHQHMERAKARMESISLTVTNVGFSQDQEDAVSSAFSRAAIETQINRHFIIASFLFLLSFCLLLLGTVFALAGTMGHLKLKGSANNALERTP